MFTRSAAQEVRSARGVEHDVAKENVLAQGEQKAEQARNAGKVKEYLEKLGDVERDEIKKLFTIFVHMRILVLQHLKTLSYIREHINSDKDLTEDQKARLQSELDAYVRLFGTNIRNQLAGISGVDSANVNLESVFLGLSTQARELSNNAVEVRRDERRVRKIEKVVAIRHESPFMRRYGAALAEELMAMRRTANYALLFVKRLRTNVTGYHAKVVALMEHAGFPKTIGERLEQEFSHTQQFLDASIAEEIKKERIELSAVKRAA